MEIRDHRGQPIDEATVTLDPEEVTSLLVAVSELEDSKAHVVVKKGQGPSLALYRSEAAPDSPLEAQSDWWLGPLLLIIVIFTIIGAFTIARAVVNLIF
jgi:hypothetical protein